MPLRYRYCNSNSLSASTKAPVPVPRYRYLGHTLLPGTDAVAGVKDQHGMKREHHALASRIGTSTGCLACTVPQYMYVYITGTQNGLEVASSLCYRWCENQSPEHAAGQDISFVQDCETRLPGKSSRVLIIKATLASEARHQGRGRLHVCPQHSIPGDGILQHQDASPGLAHPRHLAQLWCKRG